MNRRHPSWLVALPLVAALFAALFAAPASGDEEPPPPPLNRALGEQVVFIAGPGGNRLETTLFKPAGDGPFPLVVINHGKSPGNPRFQPRGRFVFAAREFVRRGYFVAVPMREGFSKSEGSYTESGCNIEGNGLYQARSVRAAIEWLRQQPQVDAKRILVIGQSHGGLTTTALGTEPPEGVLAAVNFAGGLRLNNCPGWEGGLARAFGAYGRTNRWRMLWFYGDNDSFFPLELARDMHARYVAAGGHAELIAFGAFKADAHRLFSDGEGRRIWWPRIEALLKELGLPTTPRPHVAPVGDAQYARFADATRLPGASASCQRLYDDFLDADLPRAFALSPDGQCGYAYGRNDTQGRALGFCQRRAREPCRIYAIDERLAP